MKRIVLTSSTKAVASLLLVSASFMACKQASYEVSPRDNNTQPSPPTTVTTPTPGTTTTEPTGPSISPAPPVAGGPTAKVEVLLANAVVTRANPMDVVTIRPSADTADADDAGKANCPNPGITKVDYDFGDGKFTTVTRTNGCESLDVQHGYTSNGNFLVTMVVYTAENEKAKARTELVVGSGTSSGTGTCSTTCGTYTCGGSTSTCGSYSSTCGTSTSTCGGYTSTCGSSTSTCGSYYTSTCGSSSYSTCPTSYSSGSSSCGGYSTCSSYN